MRRFPRLTFGNTIVSFTLAAALAAPIPWAASAMAVTATVAGPRSIAETQAALAWRLIDSNAQPGAERIVSPASLTSAFAVLSLGADRAMKVAILSALGLGGETSTQAAEALAAARDLFVRADPAILQSVDYIVFAPGEPPWPFVLDGLKQMGVKSDALDLSKPEGVAKINAWVFENTQGRIPKLIASPLDKPAFTTLNALHFKSKWKEPFDPSQSFEASFQDNGNARQKIVLMKLGEASRLYRVANGFVGIELPFADDRFALVIITSTVVPQHCKDFAPVAGWLSGDGFAPVSGDLAMPRFTLDGGADLALVLERDLAPGLASPTAFAGFAAGAKIQGVLQHSTIEVSEEGAETTAATAIVVGRSLQVNDQVLHMVVDKPFLFALRDRKSGMILAAGYVGEAPKSKLSVH